MAGVRVGPAGRMDGQRRRGVEGVAGIATDTAPTDAIKLDAVTKCTTIFDIACRRMGRSIRSSPVGRMGEVGAVTAFATGPTSAVDADVEPGIASRATGLAMTTLTDRQISLGNGTMICTCLLYTSDAADE